MRRVALGAVLVVGTLAGCDDPLPIEPITEPGEYERTFEVDERTRSYVVRVPGSWDGSRALPVLVAFHGVPRGYGLQELTDLNEHAESQGAVMVYPNAFAGYGDWDVGCRYCTSASRHGVDDLKFVRLLLEKLDGELPVDRDRVYVTGFSQGGVMAERVGCALADRVAGVSTVAALMMGHLEDGCRKAAPLPTLMIQGTDDQEFPWGGRVGDLGSSLGAEQTADVWVERNGCEPSPVTTLLPDEADDGTRVERRDYESCVGAAPLTFYVVQGGGHTWPDAPVEFSDALGRTTRDINASALILSFLEAGRP